MSSESEPIVVVSCDDNNLSIEPTTTASKPQKGRKKSSPSSSSPSPSSPTKGRKKKTSGDSKKSKTSSEEQTSEEVTSSGGKRHVKSPVERVDNILEKLESSGVTKEVIAQLHRLRKQLEGAKIKQAHAPRTPNEYNLWMKNKMAELKDSEMPPKERFAYCIKLWNEEKAAAASVAIVDAEEPKPDAQA